MIAARRRDGDFASSDFLITLKGKSSRSPGSRAGTIAPEGKPASVTRGTPWSVPGKEASDRPRERAGADRAELRPARAVRHDNVGSLKKYCSLLVPILLSLSNAGCWQFNNPVDVDAKSYQGYPSTTNNAPVYPGDITYNGNGSTSGSVPIDTSHYAQGVTVTVLGNTGSLARTGYVFAGWNTSPAGGGTGYSAGSIFTMGSAGITLYAQWLALPTYTVTYNGDGSTSGSVPVDGNQYLSGGTATVLGNTGALAYAGETFAGWSTGTGGTGVVYAAGSALQIASSDVILYAVWTAQPTYTVTYNGNGATSGSVPVDGNDYTATATATVLGNTGALALAGETFAGWSTTPTGSTSYTAGSSLQLAGANVILYAVWTAQPTYTVTYNGNNATSGSVPIDGNDYTSGTTATVLGNTGSLARTGYAFAGWDTSAMGTGTSYTAGGTFSVTGNVTLYALWTPVYTVTYNGNGSSGGSVPVDSNSYAAGATVTVLGNTGSLTKLLYTFESWNTEASGGGTSYSAGSTFPMGSADVTLYAQWSLLGL